MAIELEWGDESRDRKTVAFNPPQADKPLWWDGTVEDVPVPYVYAPYLVNILELNPGTRVTFRGIDLTTAKDMAGEPHQVNLGEYSIVWPAAPSTLAGWSAATSCAILFLTDKYKRVAELKAAKGGGKYPIGKPIDELLALIKLFSEKAQGKTKEEFDEAFKEYLQKE